MKGSGDFLECRQRALMMLDGCDHMDGDYWPCLTCVTQAIEAAVLAERAACAQIVDPLGDEAPSCCDGCAARWTALKVHASSIRARGAAQDPEPGEERER